METPERRDLEMYQNFLGFTVVQQIEFSQYSDGNETLYCDRLPVTKHTLQEANLLPMDCKIFVAAAVFCLT